VLHPLWTARKGRGRFTSRKDNCGVSQYPDREFDLPCESSKRKPIYSLNASRISRFRLDYNAGMAEPPKESVILRKATPDDDGPAAGLIYETMPTLGEYLFGRPDAQETIRVLAVLFRERGHLLSFQFSILAEENGEVVGIAQALPSATLGRAVLLLVRVYGKRFGLRPALRLAWRGFPLAFEPDAKPNEYYVDTLAVAPSRRNRGIGRILLEDAQRRGREAGFPLCSLAVMLHNPNAKRFYERAGFRAERKYVSRLRVPGVQYSGFYRMVKPLSHPAKGIETK
jgi:ribosomal protein S18 acetylase RimI-like enzyme